MSIEMPRGLPFAVDTFGPYTETKRRKRHHFLTHAHKDHTVGVSPSNIVVFPIYSTSLTISLLLQRFPQLDESYFVRVEIGQSVIVDDPDGEFKVTAFDANHCPGAVMFLFEGSFGNILHTGDCRLTLDCLHSLPEKYVGRSHGMKPKCSLGYIFLDCTFGKSSHSQRFPTKHSAIRQIINCIWNHPDAPVVYLACDMLGQEDVLLEVSRTFGSKIYVDKATNLECFRSLMVIVPEIVSEDPSSRFHIFSGFPKLYERTSAKLAEARSKLQSEPLIIRPSAQWYVCDDEDDWKSGSIQKQRKVRFSEAVKDEFGLWHVCYSMHSSRAELESAMQLLSPKWVVSTVPSCRAMELNYVKKNCFISRFSPDDPFWKLLDIDMEASPVAAADTQTVALSCCLMSEQIILDSGKSKLEPVIESSSTKKKLLSLSPENSLPVTLFGRARQSSQECDQLHERKVIHTQCVYTKTSPVLEKLNVKVVIEPLQDDTKEETVEKESCTIFSTSTSKETCKDLSGDLRKLYRSMNAPVPRPLPSLMELMNARKRSRNHLSF
ncbi:unnamed protein product [Arabidopsis thaliana]|jgi:DNA cross-link repair 1A protein|uniref:DNA repair metallo-beta-lactamase domain-containing protein n=2 Tax=Arabidopsis thaliana TaxID=3702 RepID=A0A654ED26_ARATH|nr:DNA repair metallo-beta-lactamase family protein [Arabidopsis thaliana]AEE29793.1 DNA repair metallo-beta-lactamase family protein [Arabidopsis thaliana]CAA0220578.1 unnamed protein product [Arabidopsis thaliana]VYS46538.1 unnamed protein product [Arabidopsis thaliana]|eukprot:NP_564070.1 DNA repair metallo-beta-lactamase family protein [Arabidopsis thaliana]